jgi:hypothetical protein
MRGRVVVVACCISAINPTNHATTSHTVGISRNKKIFQKDYLYCSLFGVRGRLGSNSMDLKCCVISSNGPAQRRGVVPFQTVAALSLSKPSLAAQIATLERESYQWQQETQLYSDDGNFYPFSIRDSRRLVPIQLPSGIMSIPFRFEIRDD